MKVFMIVLMTLCSSASATLAGDRSIHLAGVENTRDLGGLTTTDGRTVRSGLVIRSGEIDHIQPSGKNRLDELGVAAIIDLRTTREATLRPAEWPRNTGPQRYNFPLMEKESDLIDEMRAKVKSGSARADWMDKTFFDAFGDIPTDDTDSLRKVFDVLLAQTDDDAVLYHCSGGKDRTGVVTALLLSALGVPRDQIERDFLFSNTAVDADARSEKIAQQINAAKGTTMTGADVWPSLGVRPEYLKHLYDTIESSYGSVDRYLQDALGLSDDEIRRLRARYLR